MSVEVPERQEALDWLSSTRKNVKAYGRKALKGSPKLEAAVKEKSGAYEQKFYAELENCIWFAFFSFKDRTYKHLDQMSIRLTLCDTSIYGEGTNIDVYQAAVDLIIKEIRGSQRLTEAIRTELEGYLVYLKQKLELLS